MDIQRYYHDHTQIFRQIDTLRELSRAGVRENAVRISDDALALVIHQLTGWKLARSYLFTDLVVLGASLSYIPARRIAFSLVTVTVSSLLIDWVQGLGYDEKIHGNDAAKEIE